MIRTVSRLVVALILVNLKVKRNLLAISDVGVLKLRKETYDVGIGNRNIKRENKYGTRATREDFRKQEKKGKGK